ncbi:hypothetical protein [Endozoicomonas sp. GU-1]|uniref:hypothetical protein n=1 Tax=Endozoicomonas sp. GU-1 TaxID=3009078 RepID=UPI0022B2F545|nr:hypothetical protein [Endozoicomonas sp. GU-1]WBA80090.1 hypothetical protein O2T12_17255 [Endozoicomonas sp. GU-1]
MVNIQHATGNSPEQCTQADDGTLRKVAVTADKMLQNPLDHPLQSSKMPEKTPENEALPVKNEQLLSPLLLSPLMIRPENSNHLVKRDNWLPYGDPDVFNSEFRLFVDRVKDSIIKRTITAEELIKKAINTRKHIEITRNNDCAEEFGLLRNNLQSVSNHPICTHTPLDSTYSFAKQRAVALTYNKFFINHKTRAGERFINHISDKYKLPPP